MDRLVERGGEDALHDAHGRGPMSESSLRAFDARTGKGSGPVASACPKGRKWLRTALSHQPKAEAATWYLAESEALAPRYSAR